MLFRSTGFEFSRQTARFLEQHRRGLMSHEALNALSGFPPGFWPAFLAAFEGGTPPRTPPPPRLHLDLDRAQLVIRFDAPSMERAAYRSSGTPVRYPTLPVRGPQSKVYEIVEAGVRRAAEVEPWWTPSESEWALFRAADGLLVHVGENLRAVTELDAGCYIYVGRPDRCADLSGDDFGYLEPPEAETHEVCAIKGFQLEAGDELRSLGLRVRTANATPIIAFADGGLPGNAYYGELPDLLVQQWPPSGRFRLTCDTGDGRSREFPVMSGTDSLQIGRAHV